MPRIVGQREKIAIIVVILSFEGTPNSPLFRVIHAAAYALAAGDLYGIDEKIPVVYLFHVDVEEGLSRHLHRGFVGQLIQGTGDDEILFLSVHGRTTGFETV